MRGTEGRILDGFPLKLFFLREDTVYKDPQSPSRRPDLTSSARKNLLDGLSPSAGCSVQADTRQDPWLG